MVIFKIVIAENGRFAFLNVLSTLMPTSCLLLMKYAIKFTCIKLNFLCFLPLCFMYLLSFD